MEEEDDLPRPHDHLVEPLFGGLGVGDEPRPDPPERAPRAPWLARLRAWLRVRLFGARD